ncbi:four helix bundle protein [Patescibacteria group bacterium]|nr:four helix bundle protein [Patescibacteria group bacterium]
MDENYHCILNTKIKLYSHGVYKLTKSFPKEELYGLTSQLRRAAISVGANYTEGYARRKPLVMKNFFEISYGSLKESRYLLEFASEENYIGDIESYKNIQALGDEIGAMLWKTLENIRN